jgi:hypothetical protein
VKTPRFSSLKDNLGRFERATILRISRSEACLRRGWKLFSVAEQNRAWRAVQHGGPRHTRPATGMEKGLRHYPSSNFTHG